MRHTLRRLALVPALGLTLSALVVPSSAGPDKIKYPEAWKTHVMYTTVDRYDIKQFRELYASSQAAVDAMKAGQPLPDGTVLTLVQYKAEVDAAGAPVKGANGRFVKGDVIALTVMEKRAGFGTEYPPELRNGDWEYAAFSPAGVSMTRPTTRRASNATSRTRRWTTSSRWPRCAVPPLRPRPPSRTSRSPASRSDRTSWPGRWASR